MALSFVAINLKKIVTSFNVFPSTSNHKHKHNHHRHHRLPMPKWKKSVSKRQQLEG